MKIRHLLLSLLAFAALASACQEEENLGMPELTVTPAELSFGVDAGSQNVTVKANGYEHTDKGDHLNPPTTSGSYWVDAELATFYDADGAKVFELRYEKELTIKIEY